MEFMLRLDIPSPERLINYRDPVMLSGSCFTEHIGKRLSDLKFNVLQNPNGILFDPVSVCSSLISYTGNKIYHKDDLFRLNEVWYSWQHHGQYSGTDAAAVLESVNRSQARAHDFLKHTQWLILTLGTAFSYRLLNGSASGPLPVANCHRAPGQWFQKHLLTIEEINQLFDECLHRLFAFNPGLRVIFTVSPVRHIRDGVVDNNRSKARLLEAVHHQVAKFDRCYYFPAYELVIDVLRDYRFFDIDLVHPNYAATEFVMDRFLRSFVDEETRELAEELDRLLIARRHRPLQPDTSAHRQFLESQLQKALDLKKCYPSLDLHEEIGYFSQHRG